MHLVMGLGQLVAGATAMVPTPSPEGCHGDSNNPHAFYCNWDRQEQQLIQFGLASDYVVIPLIVAFAVYLMVSGGGPLPWFRNHLRRSRLFGVMLLFVAGSMVFRHAEFAWLQPGAPSHLLFNGLEFLCVLGAVVGMGLALRDFSRERARHVRSGS
jgi:hypothetical protein